MPRTITHSFRGGVSVTYHKSRNEADKVASQAKRRKQKVVRDTSHFCDPKTGERYRLFVVTVRPPSEWEKHAAREGFGVH